MPKCHIANINIRKLILFVSLFTYEFIFVVNNNNAHVNNIEVKANEEQKDKQDETIKNNTTNNSDHKNKKIERNDKNTDTLNDTLNNEDNDTLNNDTLNDYDQHEAIYDINDDDYCQEYTQIFNDACNDEQNNRYVDAINKYEALLTKYIISQNSMIVYIKIHLARCLLKIDEYKKCKAYFFNILEKYKPFPLNVQETREEIIKELCEIINSKIIYRDDLDISEAEELVKVINTYKKEIKSSEITEYINDLYKKTMILIEKHQINYIKYFFNKKQYNQALFLCDSFLKNYLYTFCKKEVCVLKLQILHNLCLNNTVNNFEHRNNFIIFFDTLRKTYKQIYQENQSEFDTINENFQKEVINKERK